MSKNSRHSIVTQQVVESIWNITLSMADVTVQLVLNVSETLKKVMLGCFIDLTEITQ